MPWSKFFLIVLGLDQSYCSIETILKGLIIHNSWTFLNLTEPENIVHGSVHLSSDSGLCLNASTSIEDMLLKGVSKQRLASTWYSWPFSPEMNCYINPSGNCISGALEQGLPSCSNASKTVHPPSSALNLIRILTSSNIQTLEVILRTELGDRFVDASTCLTKTDVATYGAALALDAIYSLQNISRAFCDVPPAVSVLSNSTCEASAIASVDTFLNQPWTFPIVSPMLPDICYISVPVVGGLTDLTDGLLSHDRQTNLWTFPATSSPIPPPPGLMSVPQTLETCEPYRGNSVECSTQDMWACDSVEGCFADWGNSVCADTPPGFYSTSMSLVSQCNPIPLDQRHVGLAWTNPRCLTKCIDPSEYLVDNDCTSIPTMGQYVGVCDDDSSLHSCTTSMGEGLVSFTTVGTCDGAFLKYLLLSHALNIICVWIYVGEHSAELRLFGQPADYWELRLLPSGDLRFVSTELDVRTDNAPSGLNTPSWTLFLFDGSNFYLDGNRIVFAQNISVTINASGHVFYGPSSSAAGFTMMGPFDIPLIDLSADNAAAKLFELLPAPPGYSRQEACSTCRGPELEICPEAATSTSTETVSTEITSTDTVSTDATEPSPATSTETVSTEITSTDTVSTDATESSTITSTEAIVSDATEPSTTTSAENIFSDATEPSTTTSEDAIVSDASEPSTTTSTEAVVSEATEAFTTTAAETILSDATEAFTIASAETRFDNATEPPTTTGSSDATETFTSTLAETVPSDATTTTDPPGSSAVTTADLGIIEPSSSTNSADPEVPSIASESTSPVVTDTATTTQRSVLPTSMSASDNFLENFTTQEQPETTSLISPTEYSSTDPSSFATAYDIATKETHYEISPTSTTELPSPISSYEAAFVPMSSSTRTSTIPATEDIPVTITPFPETSSATIKSPIIQVFPTPDEVTTTPDIIRSQLGRIPAQVTSTPQVDPSFTSASLESRSPVFPPETATASNTMTSSIASTNASAEPGAPRSDASHASQDSVTSTIFRTAGTEEIVLIGSATGTTVGAVILLATTITCLYRRRTTQPIISRN